MPQYHQAASVVMKIMTGGGGSYENFENYDRRGRGEGRGNSRHKVLRGSESLVVSKFVFWYTLGVSFSAKLASGRLQS